MKSEAHETPALSMLPPTFQFVKASPLIRPSGEYTPLYQLDRRHCVGRIGWMGGVAVPWFGFLGTPIEKRPRPWCSFLWPCAYS